MSGKSSRWRLHGAHHNAQHGAHQNTQVEACENSVAHGHAKDAVRTDYIGWSTDSVSTYTVKEKKNFINKQCRRSMPAHRLRANASARATRKPTRRAAHQRVRRAALTHVLACVHLSLHRCRAFPFCASLLQPMHSHTTTLIPPREFLE